MVSRVVPLTDSRTLITTAQLAERTGVPAGTLRIWEARHGFPAPIRLPSGHRRYPENEVERVRAVVRGRDQGLSLAAAIARASGERARVTSIFAGLRDRRPDLQPMRMTKPALLALSRAIEDEQLAHGRAAALIGSFQTERFYRQSERRWHELARTAEIAVVLAEFAAARNPPRAPHEVPIGRDHPLVREWAIVASGDGVSACLAAWERPGVADVADPRRRFEVLWSPEPEVVQVAIAVTADLVAPLAPGVGARLAAIVERSAPVSTPELRAASRQAQRIVAYLSRQLAATSRAPRDE
jgi:MerR family transcriptional regulator, light-induced transcriptional regulator